MKYNFKLNAISAGMIASFMALPLVAQEAQTQEPQTSDDVEVIEVTGFKSSLQKAMNAKRFSDSVSDSIHAEDVGKSTDQNIADALSRVTGITVQEEAGEGTRISIRGAGPSLNQITVNGVALTSGLSTDGSDASATNDNSVDLSSFSSDILSSIDVVKTASSDQDEGSLGGSVTLRTIRPLSLNKPRRSFTLEGRYNEFSDETDSRMNFSLSDKFLDEKLGFIVTASKDNQKTRQDRIQTDWQEGALPIADWEANSGRKATDLVTGQPIRVLRNLRDADGAYLLDESGNRMTESIDTLTNYDASTQTLHEGDLYAAAREFVGFALNTDERERFSVSTGIQYQPTDDLDIQLDVTHTEQDVYTDNQRLVMNISPVNIVGDGDINVVNRATNTLEKAYGRGITGGFNRSSGLREIDTDVASLRVDFNITDALTMNFMAGYSRTTDETPDQGEDGRFIQIGTNTWGSAGREVVEGMPTFENVGYDCTAGSLNDCSFATGTTPGVFDALDGTAVSVTSRFNPFDMQHNHLGRLVLRNNKLKDESKSLFIDFDYDLDNDYITSVEFGVKWSEREKSVHIQNLLTENGRNVISPDDIDAPIDPRGLGTIKLSDIISGEAFPYDNYGEDIQSDRSNAFFGGWPMLSGERALELVGGKKASDLAIRETNEGSRNILTETYAAYAKANFEAFDGRLTGNVGVRFIKDESVATGIGGINYIRAPQVVTPYDLLVTRQLANMDLPACPDVELGVFNGANRWQATPLNDGDLQNCWAWQVTHAYNRNDPSTFPYDNETGEWLVQGADGQTGPDVNRLVFADYNNGIPTFTQNNVLPAQVFNNQGALVDTNAGNWIRFNGPISPWVDRSTTFTTALFEEIGEQTRIRTASVTNAGENDLVLPSLNLNYAISEEMIGRFAISRTMSRPRFDSLNPRTQLRENQWGASSGSAGNTQLKPLESTNVDFSYEWYFNPSSMVSAALFFKKMENFEQSVLIPYHYKDARTDYAFENADLLIDFDANRAPGDADNCMPRRVPAGWVDQWTIECDVINVTTVRNGAGADIKGLEVGYTQNYDFMPGIWSSLGASVNYTYQHSENEVEEIGTTGRFFKPLPQPYTPKHSGNVTFFWERDGIQLRLANRYNDTQLAHDGGADGATWQDATNRLDFSSSYQITKQIAITFQGLNLTDDTRRIFYTTNGAIDATDANNQTVVLEEGNVLEDSGVPTSRTAAEFKTGRQFRLGIRGTF